MYQVHKVNLFNLLGQIKVNNILFDCGKNMAKRYNLHHWDNSHLKNFLIVAICELKNTVYLVTKEERPVATFQIKKVGKTIRFEKLACSPKCSGKGIGSFCMKYIEEMAKKEGCERVEMEVYSSSQHALNFYLHKGYKEFGRIQTLKYTEIKMGKKL